MKIKYFLMFIIIMFITCGCAISPYTNKKYGELAIDNWFSDKQLAELRKRAENISEIVDRECVYVEHKNNKYVFKCKLIYKEKGETVIPLSKNSSKEIYAVFIKKSGKKYTSRVYNSMYTKEKYKVWKKDKNLNY